MFRAVLFSTILCFGFAATAVASDPDVLAVLQKDAPDSADSALRPHYTHILWCTRRAVFT